MSELINDPWMVEQWSKRLGSPPFRIGQIKEVLDECQKFGRHSYDPLAERCVRCGHARCEDE